MRAAGLAAIAASVAGCAGPAITGTPGASSRASSTPACQGRQLKIRMIYGGPAAGVVGGVIGFTNEGSTPCSMAGWPALMAIGPAGRATAGRTLAVFAGPTLARPPVVTISPGAQAAAVLSGPDAPGPGVTKCPPAYRRLRVTPPGSGRAAVISAWIPYSDAYLPACGPIEISPLIAVSALPYLRLHHV